jgi:hypothetical protein
MLLFGCSGGATAGVENLTLYQKTARAALVVRARAISDSTRRPEMEVLEVYKGSYPAHSLTIAPHFEDYGSPTPWLRREVFRKGVESVLFLSPYQDEFGRDEGAGTFALLNADQGKLDVPAEGGDALIAAVRKFVGILSLEQSDRQSAALRGLLGDKNPFLVEAALSECRKFRLGQAEDTDALFSLLGSRRAEFRAGALTILGQMLTDQRTLGGPEIPSRQAIFERVAARARMDEDEGVRKESVAVLGAFADSAALALIESIGRSDASQSVRYQAQVTAFRLREKLH